MTTTPGQLSSAAASPNTTTLERVARAIFWADHVGSNPAVLDAAWERPANFDFKAKYIRIATAALQALREVDDATVEAMVKVIRDAFDSAPSETELELMAEREEFQSIAHDVFTAAIDHILGETPNQGSER